jgi:hypothetical protein
MNNTGTSSSKEEGKTKKNECINPNSLEALFMSLGDIKQRKGCRVAPVRWQDTLCNSYEYYDYDDDEPLPPPPPPPPPKYLNGSKVLNPEWRKYKNEQFKYFT